MDNTDRLALPYIIAAQAQKHVTHNEALRRLDLITHLAVQSRTVTTEPASPHASQAWIVPDSGASGLFADKAGQVMAFQDGGWAAYVPATGWKAWVADEEDTVVFDGTSWRPSFGSVDNQIARLGINGMADATNRLSVHGPATLLTNDIAVSGDHRLTLNRDTDTDTGSIVFQTGFSGRAEIGYVGDDAFRLKISTDGSQWRDVLTTSGGTASFSGYSAFRSSPGGIIPTTGDDSQLAFHSVRNDLHGDYDGTTGQFTAPADGTYMFCATVRFDSLPAGGWCRLYLAKNGSSDNFRLGHIISGGNHSTDFESLSLSTILILIAGDVISLHGGRSGGGGSVHPKSSFSGARVN